MIQGKLDVHPNTLKENLTTMGPVHKRYQNVSNSLYIVGRGGVGRHA